MPKFYSSKEIEKVLKNKGFIFISQKGSHGKFTNGSRTAIVPMSRKEMPQGTFSSILRQSGLSKEDFK